MRAIAGSLWVGLAAALCACGAGEITDGTQGGGVAVAENEIPRWPVSMVGSVEAVIREGIEMMMDEGEGGPHHHTILGAYTKLGCGIYKSGDIVTVVQDFGN